MLSPNKWGKVREGGLEHKVNREDDDKMKIPKQVKMYCKFCHEHTDHEVERVRKRKASELKHGQRLFRRVTSGYGGFPRPKPEGREKPTKRVSIRFRCTKCKRALTRPTQRAKKFEILEVHQ